MKKIIQSEKWLNILIWAICLTVGIMWILSKFVLNEPVLLQVTYLPQENEDTVERVIVSSISGDCIVDCGDFTFEEERQRYVLDGKKQGSIFFALSKMKSFEFLMEYRLKDADLQCAEQCFEILSYENELLKSEEQIKLKDFDYDGVKCSYLYCQGVKVLFQYGIVIFGILCVALCLLCYCFHNKYKVPVQENLLYEILQMAMFSGSCFVLRSFLMDTYAVAADTNSYCIDSISELLSNFHRMPGYQLLIFSGQLLTAKNIIKDTFEFVMVLQIIMAIISVIALYDALRLMLHKQIWAKIFAMLYAVLVTVYGYTEIILTESVGVSLTCYSVWCVVKLLKSDKYKYMWYGSSLALIHTLIRPSGVFLFPILFVFYLIYACTAKKEKDRKMLHGMSSWILSVAGLLIYCSFNKMYMGQFMINPIAYHNQLGIMIQGDMYHNENYLDVEGLIREQLEEEEDTYESAYLGVGKDICAEIGYQRAAEYLSDTRKENIFYYIKFIIKEKLIKNWDENIIQLPGALPDSYIKQYSVCFDILRLLILPYNYQILLLLMIGAVSYGIISFLKTKKVEFMWFGIPGCILCVFIISVISLISAEIQRIAVTIIPLAIILNAMIVDLLIETVLQKVKLFRNK